MLYELVAIRKITVRFISLKKKDSLDLSDFRPRKEFHIYLLNYNYILYEMGACECDKKRRFSKNLD